MYRVTYQERPGDKIIIRNIIAYSHNDVRQILKYEDDITKNNLVIITIE